MPEINLDCHCTVQHIHGTAQCYRTCKCRRQECREADAAARRTSDRQRLYGRSTTHHVPAAPVRKHLKKLMKLGWNPRAISKETGVPISTIDKIIYTLHGSKQKSIKAVNAEKLLAFNPETKREKFDGTITENIDATGSRRRIQALVALGFSYRMLADYTGHNPSYYKDLTSAKRITVPRAEAITALYENLWNKKPLPQTTQEKKSVAMAKNSALKNGWLPPMDWDDGGINNPDYDPNATELRRDLWHPDEHGQSILQQIDS